MAVKVPTWLENKEGDRVISISKIHKDVEHLSITAEDGKFGTFCNLFYAGSDRFYSFVARSKCPFILLLLHSNVYLLFCCLIQMCFLFFCCRIRMFFVFFCCQIWMFFILFPNRSKCFFSKILLLPDRILKKILFTGGSKPFYLFFSSSETECIFTLLLYWNLQHWATVF